MSRLLTGNLAPHFEEGLGPGRVRGPAQNQVALAEFSLAFLEGKSNLSIPAGQFGKALCVHTMANFGGAPNGS
jgi:hypothetical protein